MKGLTSINRELNQKVENIASDRLSIYQYLQFRGNHQQAAEVQS